MYPSDERSTSLPPADHLSAGGRLRQGRGFANRVTLLIVVGAVLAFLLASVPSRDSDLWGRLAMGRALIRGHKAVNTTTILDAPSDPHHRLDAIYDVLLYAGYAVLGGSGLVVLNACIAAALALMLFLLGRSGGDATCSGFLAMLTVVAISAGFEVAPLLISYSLFVSLLVLIRRAICAAERGDRFWRACWPVLIVIAAWANIDRWVVLGPAAVCLCALGEWASGYRRAARLLGLAILPALAASILSPNHVAVWNLSILTSGEATTGGAVLFASIRRWFEALPTIIGVAYVSIFIFGLIGIALDRRRRTWSWVPLWMALVGLSVWRPLAFTPFLAMTAVPLATVGFSQCCGQVTARRPRLAFVASLSALIAGVFLVVAAWPGWLQGPPYARRVWSVEVNEPLQDAVKKLISWKRDGSLGNDMRALTFSPDVANYVAWFGNSQNGSSRAEIGAADFFAVRDGLLREGLNRDEESKDAQTNWRQILRDHQINHLILSNSNTDPTVRIFERLARLPEEWPLLYLRGDTVIFGWRDRQAQGDDPFGRLTEDLEQRAYGPSRSDLAPFEWPGRLAAAPRWWAGFEEPPPAPSPDRAEAALYLAYFDVQRERYSQSNRSAWLRGQSAGMVASLASSERIHSALEADLFLRFAHVRSGWGGFAAVQDEGPYGVLLLAVRAARRAIRINPNDAGSYFLLGESYLRLAQNTRERAWLRQLPAFERIRHAQTVVAYNQALVCRPDFLEAHGRLARLYRDLGSMDLAVKHLQGMLDAARRRGPHPGESLQVFQEGLAPLEEEKNLLEKEIRRRESDSRQEAGGRPVLDVARDEAARAMPEHALKTLLKSDVAEFGREGAELELELLLWSGRIQEVRDWSRTESDEGTVSYHELLVRLAAATGDYAETDRELQNVGSALMIRTVQNLTPHAQAAYDVARAIHQSLQPHSSAAALAQTALAEMMLFDEVEQIATALRREANANVVRGLLALEAGHVDEAKSAFESVLRVWKNAEGPLEVAGLDFSGRPIAQECLRLISAHSK